MKYNINSLTRQRKRFSLANLFEEYTVKLFVKNWALITLFPSWWPSHVLVSPPKSGGAKKKSGGRKEKFSALLADHFYGPPTFRNVPLPLAGSA